MHELWVELCPFWPHNFIHIILTPHKPHEMCSHCDTPTIRLLLFFLIDFSWFSSAHWNILTASLWRQTVHKTGTLVVGSWVGTNYQPSATSTETRPAAMWHPAWTQSVSTGWFTGSFPYELIARLLQTPEANPPMMNHIVPTCFEILNFLLFLFPSGRQYVLPACKTNCFSRSFIPSALRI